MQLSTQPEADALVLFGSTGDLSKRKLFPALYKMERAGRLSVPVIGVARDDWTDERFRQHAQDSVTNAVQAADQKVIDALQTRLHLVSGDYAQPALWQSLTETLDRLGSKNAVFYMAIPPTMFPTVAEALAWGRRTVTITLHG